MKATTIKLDVKPFQVYRGGRRRARIRLLKKQRAIAIANAKSNSARMMVHVNYQRKMGLIWMSSFHRRLFAQFMQGNKSHAE